MEEVVLKAQKRSVIGKQVKVLRRAGQLPAVIYGKGFDPIAITLDLHSASKILPRISSSHLIVVEVDGIEHNTLVRDKQREPITGGLLHVDFLEVSLTEKLRTVVIIHVEGEAPAVKNYNGVVIVGTEEIEVEALPRDLPERIVVDISTLAEIGDAIYVRDLVISPKVRVLSDPDEIIVNVAAPVVEVEAEEVAVAVPEPEVIERGKKPSKNGRHTNLPAVFI
ncbi:MAG: rplY [Chloroflexi bacterium]|nr:rplY [Chloroflexota bacterium]